MLVLSVNLICGYLKQVSFVESYMNNASPTGYESEGQKIWVDYLKPMSMNLSPIIMVQPLA